jgi:hypothetical protein
MCAQGQESPETTQKLVQEKIKQLEDLSGEPERKELARLRKRLLKEAACVVSEESGNRPDDKISYLHRKLINLVRCEMPRTRYQRDLQTRAMTQETNPRQNRAGKCKLLSSQISGA